MIHRHEIPILEFDDNPQAVIMPAHEGLDLHLPEKCIYAFLEDEIERFAKAVGAKQVASFVSATKIYPVYVMEHQGEEICLAQAPVGSAAAAQFMDWLIGYGVKKIISAGSCGVLVDMEENAFLIPTKALRDEGASYHYVAPSRYIEVDRRALTAIERVLKQESIPYQEVMTWSTDGFYRETPDKVKRRLAAGAKVVDMEASAIMAWSQFRKSKVYQFFYTADYLDHHNRTWDARHEERTADAMIFSLSL